MIQRAAMAVSERDLTRSLARCLKGLKTQDSSGDGEQQNLPHPCPYLKELFEIVGSKKVHGECGANFSNPRTTYFCHSKHVEVSSVLLLL